MSEVKRYTLPEVPHLVHGRTNGSLTPLTLFWTSAGLFFAPIPGLSHILF